MTFSLQEDKLQRLETRLSNIVRAVLDRGYDEAIEDIDDYSLSLKQFEFKKLVTFQLYEVYFPPRRHEFELQLLTEIVDGVVSSGALDFLSMLPPARDGPMYRR